MNLTTVTISGADNKVDPKDLVSLSAEYPFVEWGILRSHSRAGTARYPHPKWIQSLMKAEKEAGIKVRKSCHLCGEAARNFMNPTGEKNHWYSFMGLREFDRIQVNGWAPENEGADFHKFVRFLCVDKNETILQVRTEAHFQRALETAEAIGGKVAALYDVSGGTGMQPFRWSSPPKDLRMGYAGGINPQNVESVVTEILDENMGNDSNTWIDMETGVREKDKFSLDKVRLILTIVKPYVQLWTDFDEVVV